MHFNSPELDYTVLDKYGIPSEALIAAMESAACACRTPGRWEFLNEEKPAYNATSCGCALGWIHFYLYEAGIQVPPHTEAAWFQIHKSLGYRGEKPFYDALFHNGGFSLHNGDKAGLSLLEMTKHLLTQPEARKLNSETLNSYRQKMKEIQNEILHIA